MLTYFCVLSLTNVYLYYGDFQTHKSRKQRINHCVSISQTVCFSSCYNYPFPNFFLFGYFHEIPQYYIILFINTQVSNNKYSKNKTKPKTLLSIWFKFPKSSKDVPHRLLVKTPPHISHTPLGIAFLMFM